jgi:Domain of unknown function (DUF4157)
MRWRPRGRRPRARTPEDELAPRGVEERSPWVDLQRLVGNRFVQRVLARHAPGSAGRPRRSAPDGAALAAPERADLELTLGEDLADVRVHDDGESREAAARLDASAFSAGRDIYLGTDASVDGPSNGPRRRLIAHEAIHVLQRRRADPRSMPRAVTDASEPAEREAASGTSATSSGQRAALSAVPSGVIARQPTPPTAKGTTSDWPGLEPPYVPPPTHVFEAPGGGTPAGAKKIIENYAALQPHVRRSAVEFSYPRGTVATVLKALAVAEAEGALREPVGEILRFIEEIETRMATGKTVDQMAQIEASWEQSRQRKAAQQALGRPASEAEVEQERQRGVEQRSYHHPAQKTRWEKLTKPQQAAWTAKANQAISTIVAHAATAFPALKLSASDFKHGFHEIDKNSPGALAQAARAAGGGRVVEIGFEFVEIVQVNPAYALSTVVHEMRGHVEFDSPGATRTWQMELYQNAGAKIPGYVPNPTAEATSFGYHESEIYSYLRELPYWTPTAAKDKKFAHLNPDPRELMLTQLKEIASEWEPTLLVALLRGLYKRFVLDPRLEASALTAFKNAIKATMSASDAAQILK